MSKNRKPGWTYMFSEVLQQEIAINDKTGWAVCEDGTRYSPAEMLELKKTHGKIPWQVHVMKQQFGGTIVSAEDK